ncbi:MAG: sugar ABC transporter ATP-binding protein [Christensenellales bacterium]|jgi:monosaccharide-transporting ATPase
MSDNILEMKGIVKNFPGVYALKGVDFSVRTGEVHAMMGENGAGKSTLIKVLTGVYGKDGGSVWFDGKDINPRTPLDAQLLGISPIYQELNMIPYLSAGENIYLGRFPRKNSGGIDWKKLYADAQQVMDGMGIHLDVKKQLNTLGAALQQMVAIARAISLNCKLVVMDEPTSSLDTNEVKVLFDLVHKLKATGISFIFISHRLDEVYQISDRITILKDGGYVGTYNTNEISKFELIGKMVGRELQDRHRVSEPYKFGDMQYLIELKDLVQAPAVNGVSFGIKKGEIVGLAGLLGSGRTETAKLMFGYERPDSGSIEKNGKKLKLRTPKDALKAGLALCTENRREEGIIPHMSVRDNICIAALPRLTKFGFVARDKQEEITAKYIERFDIKTPSQNQALRNLSGGNQQKVLLARWLATNPQLIILDEPTRGIDVGAKVEIEKLIKEFASMGISVLFISSELSELVRNCDRIVIIREGKILGEVVSDEIREDNIMRTIAQDHVAYS